MNEPRQQHSNVLIVGYGNELRADDGIGPWVAERIRRRAFPNVQTLALPQLLPEVAAQLAEVRQAFFVDACVPGESHHPGVRILPLAPAAPTTSWTTSHLSHPAALLALCQALYGRCPQAWLVLIDGERFEGNGLSPLARQRAEDAVRQIAARIPVSSN